jgi:hypothetical protein
VAAWQENGVALPGPEQILLPDTQGEGDQLLASRRASEAA